LGYTALMQISTQKADYLIDTIALHDVMSILRPVFANPSICKVVHLLYLISLETISFHFQFCLK
jgi:hypothetical protein